MLTLVMNCEVRATAVHEVYPRSGQFQREMMLREPLLRKLNEHALSWQAVPLKLGLTIRSSNELPCLQGKYPQLV